ncbi:sigma-70 family RNA polymerase sigma factor [Haloferula sp.]|uniref:sigma-70 family RNA polymerase sigma factor n=1 Tax=Haloferula sp. TaxID=2497595 RepID=UPI003C796FA3
MRAKEPGDLQAYVKLMTEHQGNLRAFIVSLIPGSPDVADVLQETNAALWQKRERFQLGTDFIAWSFQIARYEVQRQRARAMRTERLAFSENLVSLLGTMEAPDESAEELMTALDGCIEKLTEPQRELVFTRYTPGQSIEQLATRTGRSAGGLRISLLRIREMLKLCIERSLTESSA